MKLTESRLRNIIREELQNEDLGRNLPHSELSSLLDRAFPSAQTERGEGVTGTGIQMNWQGNSLFVDSGGNVYENGRQTSLAMAVQRALEIAANR